jgi:hypothetical protein
MLQTFRATLRGDSLEWEEEAGRNLGDNRPVQVLVTILEGQPIAQRLGAAKQNPTQKYWENLNYEVRLNCKRWVALRSTQPTRDCDPTTRFIPYFFGKLVFFHRALLLSHQ